jgi:stage V sporulation protein D (sporulation-specific penicillin-binding protein)
VVLKGTGRNAFIDGYRVAGKTGTAQVVGEGGGYVAGRYVASFVGFAPVVEPRIAALVMVAEPQGGIYFGSQVAAPVFQAVVHDTLHYLRVPETPGLKRPEKPFVYEEPRFQVEVPNAVNYPVSEGIKMLIEKGLNYRLRGDGNIVYGQLPRPGAIVMNGATVVLDLQSFTGRYDNGEVTMPNLSGLTRTEASELLKNLDLYLELSGTGIAGAQDPAPGKKVRRGTTVRVEFIPPGLQQPKPAPGEAPPVSGSIRERDFLERP